MSCHMLSPPKARVCIKEELGLEMSLSWWSTCRKPWICSLPPQDQTKQTNMSVSLKFQHSGGRGWMKTRGYKSTTVDFSVHLNGRRTYRLEGVAIALISLNGSYV